MVSEERKQKLLVKINEANNILRKYDIQLSYGQYTADCSAPLEPRLFISMNRKSKYSSRLISMDVVKPENEEISYLQFYVGEYNLLARTLEESSSQLDILSDALRDIKLLNGLELWVSKDLVSLH